MLFNNKYTKAAEKYWNASLPPDEIIHISNTVQHDGTYTISNVKKYGVWKDHFKTNISFTNNNK